jgi:hypothetical protein
MSFLNHFNFIILLVAVFCLLAVDMQLLVRVFLICRDIFSGNIFLFIFFRPQKFKCRNAGLRKKAVCGEEGVIKS